MWKANIKNLLVACVFLSVIVCPAMGKIIYVNDDANGLNDGTSWTDAYTDLQSGLLTSLAGDQIWVAAGTYKPGTSPSHSFRMKNGVESYGGFPDSGDPNMSDRDWYVNPTILSGDIGVEGYNLDNCRRIFYHPSGTNLDSSAVLDGFTITAGYGTGTNGAGMYNQGCSPTISNCTFVGNIAPSGGALYNISYSSPILVNCIVYDNTATTFAGGGIYNAAYSSPVLTNCTFYGNTATQRGGGIYNEAYSSPTITNCILWQDTAGTAGNEIYDWANSSSFVTYSDVDGGTGQS
ncbi:MAG: right-handed parallel beta-helix repeat-containing protein, partial [Planctomycetota bacterium]